LFTKEFSMEEIKEAIKNISNKKQPEHDKIFSEFIKNLGPKAIDKLLLIYNKFCTSKICVPADWTKTMIIPILKPENQQKKRNQINQSLLSQSSKEFLKE